MPGKRREADIRTEREADDMRTSAGRFPANDLGNQSAVCCIDPIGRSGSVRGLADRERCIESPATPAITRPASLRWFLSHAGTEWLAGPTCSKRANGAIGLFLPCRFTLSSDLPRVAGSARIPESGLLADPAFGAGLQPLDVLAVHAP